MDIWIYVVSILLLDLNIYLICNFRSTPNKWTLPSDGNVSPSGSQIHCLIIISVTEYDVRDPKRTDLHNVQGVVLTNIF